MNFSILSIDKENKTMVIDWGNGVTLNHNIPLYILENPDIPIAEKISCIEYMRPTPPVELPVPLDLEALVHAPAHIPPSQEELIVGFVLFLENQYDRVAREKNYDNRITCALRAGYAGPFQQEGIAFGIWMDGCNALAYQVMAEVIAGSRLIPTQDELWMLMPPMVWPS